jgi:hypothetical protein
MKISHSAVKRNDKALARLSKRARDDSRARFSLEQMFEVMEKVYREALAAS